MFCYEAMRTFGDRIMRPASRVKFLTKLADICKREFLCGKSYTPEYIEGLIMGNYHVRAQGAHVAYQTVSDMEDQRDAIAHIHKKCKSKSGN